ncbi:MAG: S41 family peptidase [Cyanobacteria bacterium P01_D01_bin.36]
MASPNAADSTDEPGSLAYDLPLTPATRTAVLGAIGQKLEAEYAFPEVAKKIQADIQNRLATEGYQDVKSGAQLATTLTAQLQTLSSDLHLKVHFSPAVLPHLEPQTEIPPDELALQQQQGALRNFDFNRVERLRGNVGYLELFSFEPPEFAGAVAAASMQFLANTSALIIDLRHNRGGSASMVALLTSYLFPPYPAIHLTNLQWPKKESSQTTGPSGTQQSWTLPYVEGPRYLNKPVYILIGPETFSAAEEFAYNLKHLKRVVLVGETTAGGANPGTGFRLHDHFWMFIPTGQAISIVTGGNWEGSGVLPDFKVPAELSVKTAQLLAFRKLLRDDSEGDSPGQLPSSLKRELEESLTKTEDDLNRMQQDLVSNMSKIR